MNKTSLWSILYCIWASLSCTCNGFSRVTNPIHRSATLSLASSKYRCVQALHLQPQLQDEYRLDSALKAAPIESLSTVEEKNSTALNLKVIIPVVTVLAVAAVAVASGKFGTFDFAQVVEQSASKIEKMGPYGYLYFAVVSQPLFISVILYYYSF